MNLNTRAVVITGTSSGIGSAVTAELAARGYLVFAGVRNQADFARLSESPGQVQPLFLDVTDEDAIARAVDSVTQQVGGGGLAGLVNNAGLSCGGVLEYIELADIRRVFEVNVFGPLLVTRAFLPLLRQGAGRIVNISSGLGEVALPLVGPYSMSKHAFEAMSDALRLEVRRSGVGVSIIQPGVVDTPQLGKGNVQIDREHDSLPADAPAHYGHAIRELRQQFDNSKPGPPEAVARTVFRALTARWPRARYKVGMDARLLSMLETLLPVRVRDHLFGRMVDL